MREEKKTWNIISNNLQFIWSIDEKIWKKGEFGKIGKKNMKKDL